MTAGTPAKEKKFLADNDLVRYFHGEIDHNKYKYLKKDKTMSRQFGYGN